MAPAGTATARRCSQSAAPPALIAVAISERPYEAWLDISIDHVIPTECVKRLGYPHEWVADIANLVTSCRACNEFLNGYRVSEEPPQTSEDFFELRDRHFVAKRAWVLARHEHEQAWYAGWLSQDSG